MSKIKSERESRAGLLATARRLNCEGDVRAILDKYDRALKNCTNDEERQAIATSGLVELHKFFYCRGNLVVNGVEIIPADKDFKDPTPGKIIKL